MTEHTFLTAIGTDELPPKILKKLGIDLSNHIKYELEKNKIRCDTMKWFAAPRHIAVKTKILISEKNYFFIQNKDIVNHSNNNAKLFNNDSNLHTSTNHSDKQVYKFDEQNLFYKKNKNIKNFEDLLIKIINQSLEKLINYKMMRWGNICTPFIRPVNTITILLDSNLIPGRIFGINIDRILYGHRFIQHNKIILNHANDYPDFLTKKGHIIVDYKIRKKYLKIKIEKQATKLGGVVDIQDDKFLEEITSSIEWPVILSGKFNKRFLTLPPEVIIHIMQQNQKYFPVYNIINGILLPCFIFVVNTITNNYKKIITGHEEIIKTRFIDAEFFLKNDSQYRLEEYIPKLNSILFHSKLGNMHEKINRITDLSAWIANQINEDIIQTKRAGYLCKCDLMSDMVREFPDLQGIIGMHYARRDGELDKVSLAQKEHYQPRYITDTIPTERISCIISIADKIDTISGIFGVEKFPTSNRDPFALKRSATGILKIIIHQKLSINLIDLINKSINLYGSKLTNIKILKNNIYKFMYNRLCSYYFSKGYRADIIKSVINTNFNNILTWESQIKAIDNFCTLKKTECTQLHSIYKRISNILKKQNISFDNKTIQQSLLIDPKEIDLFSKITETEQEIQSLPKNNDYKNILIKIENLSNFAHIFLDHVIVIDNDQQIKMNRLTLLNTLKNLILKVIDITILKT